MDSEDGAEENEVIVSKSEMPGNPVANGMHSIGSILSNQSEFVRKYQVFTYSQANACPQGVDVGSCLYLRSLGASASLEMLNVRSSSCQVWLPSVRKGFGWLSFSISERNSKQIYWLFQAETFSKTE